jgi:integrase
MYHPLLIFERHTGCLLAARLRPGRVVSHARIIPGTPLHLDNLARRVLAPAFASKKIGWHGWHAFRRGLATNLHALGVEDKTIQAILRHSTLALTMNVYVKTIGESQSDALDSLSEKLGICNDHATERIQ